jgi:glycogen debranching enzyme
LIRRAVSDVHLMTTELPAGSYPFAGVPWFKTPFGRDGIITALECLWLRPQLARGVLSAASTKNLGPGSVATRAKAVLLAGENQNLLYSSEHMHETLPSRRSGRCSFAL